MYVITRHRTNVGFRKRRRVAGYGKGKGREIDFEIFRFRRIVQKILPRHRRWVNLPNSYTAYTLFFRPVHRRCANSTIAL